MGLFFGGGLSACLGFLLVVITLRLRGLYVALMTFFVGEAIRFSISNKPDFTRGMLGLSVAPYPDVLGIDFERSNLYAYYYLLLVLTAAIMGFKIGRAHV